ncbi:MAG TPA: phosphatase PAP2 family protein [Solirubrobacterales bacterium]|nr:phosphatase PAP2 family protein [Solirubrobacterales bacterium]
MPDSFRSPGIARAAALALSGAAACVLGFVAVAVAAYSVGPVGRRDAAALAGLFGVENARVDLLAETLSHSADLLPWLAALAILGWAGARWGRARIALAGGVAAVLAVVASQVLKALLAHPRVQPVLGGNQVGPAALPSGHTTSSMSIAVMAVLVAPRGLRLFAVGLGGVYAWAVGVSLAVLAWHFPSDIFAGMLLAAGFGFLALLAEGIAVGVRSGELRVGSPGSWLERTADGWAAFGERDIRTDAGVAGSAERAEPGTIGSGARVMRVMLAAVALAGAAAFTVSVAGGTERAGRALSYADANTSAAGAALFAGALAFTLLAALALVAARSERPATRDR